MLATSLAIIVIFSSVLGVFFYLLGRLRLTRVVQLVPGAVLCGFMASIGYAVVVKGE